MRDMTGSETDEVAAPFALHLGDCVGVMRTMADSSVDAIVTDPPYELGFMGKSWDASGIAYNVEMWREALRVLKPGGHLLAFSGSRTYHRMTCAIEDAGFEVRDQIMWVYGSGFPKSQNISKAIDKQAGAEREVISEGKAVKRMIPGADQNETGSWIKDNGREYVPQVTCAALPEAETWEGWGTALKPAHEPICVARKPLAKGLTVAGNVLQFGTGAINIEACRVEVSDAAYARNCSGDRGHGGTRGADQEGVTNIHTGGGSAAAGRWPANIIHDGSAEVIALFPHTHSGMLTPEMNVKPSSGWSGGSQADRVKSSFIANEGSAARFFYCAKASRPDRNAGLPSSGAQAVATGATMREREDADWSARNGNHHPTVKPTDLMAYLVRLVTPPGGLVLDPFMGSGSIGKACMREGFLFAGVDMTSEYVEIARTRIEHERASVIAAAEAAATPAPQRDLFEQVA
jgi:site-specific DNA-methyltransferase (adenine-specific)